MGIMDALGHTLMDNDALHFDSAAALSREEQKLVTLSAPLSAFNGDFVNNLATGKSNDALREGVAQVWNVHDRASFEEVAHRLAEEGQRSAYQPVWEAITATDEAVQTTHPLLKAAMESWFPAFFQIKARNNFDYRNMASQARALGINLPQLLIGSRGWLEAIRLRLHVQSAQIPNLVAWDAVRLASLSRWAVQLGFIDRVEFVDFAGALMPQVRKAYTAWPQVSAAYIAGGLIWNASEAREENLLRTNALLLSDVNSPYRTVAFG